MTPASSPQVVKWAHTLGGSLKSHLNTGHSFENAFVKRARNIIIYI